MIISRTRRDWPEIWGKVTRQTIEWGSEKGPWVMVEWLGCDLDPSGHPTCTPNLSNSYHGWKPKFLFTNFMYYFTINLEQCIKIYSMLKKKIFPWGNQAEGRKGSKIIKPRVSTLNRLSEFLEVSPKNCFWDSTEPRQTTKYSRPLWVVGWGHSQTSL